MDGEAIEKALLRVLTEPDQWTKWSEAGIHGTRQHYSWSQHADRYLRDVDDILQHSSKPTLTNRTRERRLPEFDRLIITDLDNTLTGDPAALVEFNELIRDHEYIGFGIATGRRLDSAMALIEELGLPRPDLIDTDAGTQLHYGDSLTPDRSWRKQIGYAWNPDEIHEVLDQLPGFFLQDDEKQSEFKISYEIDLAQAPSTTAIKKLLREAGVRAKVVLSLGMYLDIIPVRGGATCRCDTCSGNGDSHPSTCSWRVIPAMMQECCWGGPWGSSSATTVPSWNDCANVRAYILPPPRTPAAFSRESTTTKFLDNIVIPNDRIESQSSGE